MLALPRPILFVGPPDSAIALSLRELPHTGVFSPGDSEGVARWIAGLRSNPRPIPATDVLDPVRHRAESLGEWIRLVEG